MAALNPLTGTGYVTTTDYDSANRTTRVEQPYEGEDDDLLETITEYSFGHDRNGSGNGLRFMTQITG